MFEKDDLIRVQYREIGLLKNLIKAQEQLIQKHRQRSVREKLGLRFEVEDAVVEKQKELTNETENQKDYHGDSSYGVLCYNALYGHCIVRTFNPSL